MSLINIKDLKGVTQDNRKVEKGYLFAALQGEHFDGRDYINDAISKGASVILSDKTAVIDDNVLSIIVDNPRQTFSHIVSEFYSNQPENIVAVTGTNGKSSVVHFIDQLWKAIDINGAFIGTLSGSMTTPDPVSMHETLTQMHGDGINNVAIEASSQGLDQYRIDGMHIDIAAFTSFSQDHLDYHKDMGSYLATKLRLFSELLDKKGVAVLNADIPEYKFLKKLCPNVLSYGENGKYIKLLSVLPKQSSQLIEIETNDKAYSIDLPLIGKFQVMNALCALACVLAQFPEKASELIDSLESLNGATGRMQHIGSNIYVDYAHTPDALKNVLNALRVHTSGRLICVFGCGGDRDKSKRPLMGAVAAKLADIVIVTDDNPRSENPAGLRKEIIGDNNFHEISDRHEAIKFAISQMGSDDILLVAGKGHEQGQVFDGRTEPFDDAFEVSNLLSKSI